MTGYCTSFVVWTKGCFGYATVFRKLDFTIIIKHPHCDQDLLLIITPIEWQCKWLLLNQLEYCSHKFRTQRSVNSSCSLSSITTITITAILLSGNINRNSGPAWSDAAVGKLCLNKRLVSLCRKCLVQNHLGLHRWSWLEQWRELVFFVWPTYKTESGVPWRVWKVILIL